ncbi:ankyrin repeat-containing domain protein [Aspergillus granulosus]|uniref:Ankyrin repeat-containing domain protein n=1 Tax=Aspergillus granulosus TaxID=176169 RepID=A0ABR4HRT8_9EURO
MGKPTIMLCSICPTEIIHAILGQATPSWEWGLYWKDREGLMLERENLRWFLNLRLVNKLFDTLVISHFHAAVRSHHLDWYSPLYFEPQTPSIMAMGARLLMTLVGCLAPYPGSNYIAIRWSSCSRLLLTTIICGVDGAVKFFSSSNSSTDNTKVLQGLRASYLSALAAVYVGLLGTKFIFAYSGYPKLEFNALDEERQEWRYIALMAAAYLGRLDDVQSLIASGVDLNPEPAENNSKFIYPPLMAAALGGQKEAVQLLINHGATPAIYTRNKENAIHFAALGGHASLVQFLADLGVAADAENNDLKTPLEWAAGAGHADAVSILLERGAGSNKTRCLVNAVAKGYKGVVSILLQHSEGLDVNTPDYRSFSIDHTPLVVAAEMGRVDIFSMLFAHPDVGRDNPKAFCWALKSGKVEIVRTILDALPNSIQYYMDATGETALQCAAQYGHEELVRFLLTSPACGIPINHKDPFGKSALHRAIDSNNIRIVRAVLEHPDFDVNLVTSPNYRHCALSYTARVRPRSIAIAEAILEHLATDRRSRNMHSHTLLAAASRYRWTELVERLLARDDVEWCGNTILYLSD